MGVSEVGGVDGDGWMDGWADGLMCHVMLTGVLFATAAIIIIIIVSYHHIIILSHLAISAIYRC